MRRVQERGGGQRRGKDSEEERQSRAQSDRDEPIAGGHAWGHACVRACVHAHVFERARMPADHACVQADVGSLQRLPRVVGSASLVREWCFTGRKVPAAEALSSGLVSRVLPTREALAAEALALCVEIAAKSPLAVSGTKAMLNYSRDHSVRESLDHVAMWNAAALQSQDVMKAMQATTARQTPIFSNL